MNRWLWVGMIIGKNHKTKELCQSLKEKKTNVTVIRDIKKKLKARGYMEDYILPHSRVSQNTSLFWNRY